MTREKRLERHAEVKVPPKEYPTVYISGGVRDPSKAVCYNLCGNPFLGFGDKSLRLSTLSCNHTFTGKELKKLYEDGVYQVHSADIFTERVYHSQTTTMIPTKVFLSMDFSEK